jgi:hypothetical protein
LKAKLSVFHLSNQEIDNLITDEMAQRDGYANADMLRKELRLGDIAARWRSLKTDDVVEEYHALFAELIEDGWNPHFLDFDQALPRELMPELPPQWRRESNKTVK